jgi:hypothetical protein
VVFLEKISTKKFIVDGMSMFLINKSKLKYPKLFACCVAFFGVLGCATLFNALRYANLLSDFIYSSIPLLLATLLYAHWRFPTPRGWLALACLLLILSPMKQSVDSLLFTWISTQNTAGEQC